MMFGYFEGEGRVLSPEKYIQSVHKAKGTMISDLQ
jgi:hypothetical protein